MSMSASSNHKAITNLIRQFSGQANVLTIPRAYIHLLNGAIKSALFLSQCVYWSDKGHDGWFYKSAEEWEAETGIKPHALEKCERDCAAWVKISVHRANGAPTNHYSVDMDRLTADLLSRFAPNGQNDLPQTGKSDLPQTGKCLTEITQETTPTRGATPPRLSSPAQKSAGETTESENQENKNGYTQSNAEVESAPEDIRVDGNSDGAPTYVCPRCYSHFTKGVLHVTSALSVKFTHPVKEWNGQTCPLGHPIKLSDASGAAIKPSAKYKKPEPQVHYYPTTEAALYLASLGKSLKLHPKYAWTEFANADQKLQWETLEKQWGANVLKAWVDWAITERVKRDGGVPIPRNVVVERIFTAVGRHGAPAGMDAKFPVQTGTPAPSNDRYHFEGYNTALLMGMWRDFGDGKWKLMQHPGNPYEFFTRLATVNAPLFSNVAIGQTAESWLEFMATKPTWNEA